MLAEVSTESAAISAGGAVIVGVLSVVAVVIQTRRTDKGVKQVNDRVDQVYDHVNRVEDDIGSGQRRTLREEMRDSFGSLSERLEVIEQELGREEA